MKSLFLFVTVAAAGLLLPGCTKQEPTATPSTESGVKAADSSATDLTKTVETAKATAEKVVTDASKQVQATAAAASSKVQELLDKAKKLVAENKYQDASAIIQELTGYQLTPDQQKLVEGLKAEIQKALANKATSEGASAVGNILGGKK